MRRSIDRLWEDQSIETCADWVIPYIGDLLSAGLVDNQDPLSQRRDVAKTIHYRRRKGTVQVLEELAGDITGWTAHVQESMRGLARSRHGLDPAIGNAGTASALAAAESLRGLLTGTPAGGVVDLRNPHGAALADTAFDESFHSADVRRGQGALGHHAIPTLLAFVWRLRSFAVAGEHAGAGRRNRRRVGLRPDRPRDTPIPATGRDHRSLRRRLDAGARMGGTRAAHHIAAARPLRPGSGPPAPAPASVSCDERPARIRPRGRRRRSRGRARARALPRRRGSPGDGLLPLRLLPRSWAPAPTIATSSATRRRRSAPRPSSRAGTASPPRSPPSAPPAR